MNPQKIKTYKCRNCGKPYKKMMGDIRKWCSYDCAVKLGLKARDNNRKRKQKESRAKTKAEKEKLRTLPGWKKVLQREINAIVRILDTGKPCIIRPDENVQRFDASHLYSRGSCPHLAFSVLNIYLGGTKSNNWRGGEELLFREGIIKRYGQERADLIQWMKGEYQNLKLTKFEIQEAIEKARQVKKRLKNGEKLSRKQIDQIIGIYTRVKK